MDQFAVGFSQFDPNDRFARRATTEGALCTRSGCDGTNKPFFLEMNGFPASLTTPVRPLGALHRWASSVGIRLGEGHRRHAAGD